MNTSRFLDPLLFGIIDISVPLLFGLQVAVFPIHTGGSRSGEEADAAFAVLDFPMLSGVVEFDVSGPVYLHTSELMQGQGFSP